MAKQYSISNTRRKDMINTKDLYAIQIDLFDNRNADYKFRSDVAIRGRIETNKTEGKWYHITGQMVDGRKPSQTRRYLQEQQDYDIFNTLVEYRENLQLNSKNGWDFKPVITTFYPKGQKSLGHLPTFFALVYKQNTKPWHILMNIGEWCKEYQLEDKGSITHKIYYANERFVCSNKSAREKYGI
jgi:hypothetical protein